MDDKRMFFKTPIGKSLIILIMLAVGFFAGMEYKAYQIRSAIDKAEKEISGLFTSSNNPATQNIASEDDTKKIPTEEKYVDKAIGEEVTLKTVAIKVDRAQEKDTISNSYGSSAIAANGAKFIVVTMTITNLTNSNLSFDTAFNLFDSKGREFSTYGDTIGNIDNYLDVAEFAPGIPKQGVYVYEVPLESTGLYIWAAKAGTDEVYHINLQ